MLLDRSKPASAQTGNAVFELDSTGNSTIYRDITGLDSSLVAATTRLARGPDAEVCSFSVGFANDPSSELGHARRVADELAEENILVNASTPGWVRTHMGGIKAPRSVVEGADGTVWLATLPDDGPTGKFFKDREEFPW